MFYYMEHIRQRVHFSYHKKLTEDLKGTVSVWFDLRPAKSNTRLFKFMLAANENSYILTEIIGSLHL